VERTDARDVGYLRLQQTRGSVFVVPWPVYRYIKVVVAFR
jgi:hypothetical protein